MKDYSIEVDGKTVVAKAQKIGSVLWFHYEGKTFSYEPVSKKRGSQGPSSENPEIEAPMPGKILKVNVDVGHAVEKGIVAIVMEAMKMEYSLEVSLPGIIEKVSCEVGDQVSQGQVLAVVKADNG